ncbi:MAG: bifunctional DNA-formamidopyrimidine glycosylase/DNA-(apurinic or apyrimidinic site) lyase [Candidatus Margulisiibacteriota bacterium]
MPELPEVETIRQHLQPYVCGTTIKNIEILDPRSIKKIAPARFKKNVEGQKILRVERRAKFLVFQLKNKTAFVIHLGMTGNLLFKPDKYVKIIFHLSGGLPAGRQGKKIYFSDIRLFGKIYCHKKYPLFPELGPEPFDEDFTSEDFYARLQSRKSKIKPLLLDQGFIAGLGNIYATESLYDAGIHPERSADSLSEKEAGKLLRSIRKILVHALRSGGSSISDFVGANGQKGSFQEHHKVYNKEGQPCEKCRTRIKKMVMAQRGTCYCPKCQPLDSGSTRYARSPFARGKK